MELEEKVLRYKLTLKDRPKLEWSWQEVKSRGGVECTILAHIDTGVSALSIQNKRHLHWKVLELIPGMNNDVEFAAPAHNLLMKVKTESLTRQESKNRAASIQASPQAAHKKRFTKLDILTMVSMRSDDTALTHDEIIRQDDDEEVPPCDTTRTSKSINHPTAQNRLSYD
jgi:hypothetical protein